MKTSCAGAIRGLWDELNQRLFPWIDLKAVLNVKDTKELVRMLRAEPLSRRLCGWDSPGLVPSETRFCCVFGEFAERGFTDEWFAEKMAQSLRPPPVK